MTSDNQNTGSDQPPAPSRAHSQDRRRRYYGRRKPRAPRLAESKKPEAVSAAPAVTEPSSPAEPIPAPETSERVEPISERIGESFSEPLREPGPAEALSEQPTESPESTRPAVAETTRQPESQLRTVEPESTSSAQPPPQEAEEKGSPIGLAIQKVQFVLDELRETLDQMEQVLELLEDAERQQITDEREIKALRKSLEGLHRGRSHSGPRPHHH